MKKFKHDGMVGLGWVWEGVDEGGVLVGVITAK
jgi:hypothetical protein